MNRRFALLQVLISLIALVAVIWWASHQESPDIPTGGQAIAYMAAAALLYTLATLVRAERWHRILHLIGVDARRADSYSLTTVGYMGNNVLPARAGEMLRVVLLDARTDAGKRSLLGTIVAERLLDAAVLGAVFVATVYGVLEGDVLPTDRPLLIAGLGLLALLVAAGAFSLLRRRGALQRFRDFARPLAGAPRSLTSRTGVALLVVTVGLWALEGGVYLTVARAVELDISTSGALYLVALTNFVAALPAAPGSIGTFDAAVAFGARALGGAGSVVISYVLLLRFVLYVPITVVGLVVLVLRYGGWSRLREAARLQTSRA
ncbi:MAG TPA: lysylphosphatidylglycerol synthase transmembrane domain-containing protein [Thermoleophilaceae bacterium]|nr:lysylphosphatidylglycerol synthase transmembrane domain-containing protein [Thermoleophilaceae bacterium]